MLVRHIAQRVPAMRAAVVRERVEQVDVVPLGGPPAAGQVEVLLLDVQHHHRLAVLQQVGHHHADALARTQSARPGSRTVPRRRSSPNGARRRCRRPHGRKPATRGSTTLAKRHRRAVHLRRRNSTTAQPTPAASAVQLPPAIARRGRTCGDRGMRIAQPGGRFHQAVSSAAKAASGSPRHTGQPRA